MREHDDDWVLVLADAGKRAAWLALLNQEGYHTLAATHAAQALALLRRSPYSLVVLLDVRHLHLLNAIIPDRRSARHHAYIVVDAPRDACGTSAARLLEQLSLQWLPYPHSTQELLDAVARAGQRFPAHQPYTVSIAGGGQLDDLVTQP